MTILQSSDLLKAAVAHLIAYVSDRGDSIGTLCGGPATARVFIKAAPDDVAMPYVVVTKAVSESDPEVSNLVEDLEIDAKCVDSDPERVELLGDLVREAFLTWQFSSESEGLLTCGSARKTTPEIDDEAEHRDRHKVIVTAECSLLGGAPLVNALT